jgi:hypothetical protein
MVWLFHQNPSGVGSISKAEGNGSRAYRIYYFVAAGIVFLLSISIKGDEGRPYTEIQTDGLDIRKVFP